MQPVFLVIDLFCGAGGTTTGFRQAMLNGSHAAKVIACVNHDPKAIQSHWQNHPEIKHYEEDIRTLDLSGLAQIAAEAKSAYPDAYLVLWASLECTNFSKAKGGLPRDPDSRTLADHLFRYIETLQPDYVQIENVVEFMSWGPLNANGKPISRKNGSDWLRWRRHICEIYNYNDDWRELNSANFGAYTSRNRLFGCFAKPWLPIVWPQATHAKKPGKCSMYGQLQKWKPVKDVLNLSDLGESIFTRKKPLSEKTLERIFAGLVKYIANGDKAFISKYFSGKPSGKNIPLEGPAGTIKTADGQALVQTISLLKYNSVNGDTGKHVPPSVDEPCPVIAAQSRLGIIHGEFIVQRNTGNPESKLVNLDGPSRTLTATAGNQQLVQPEFLDIIYGNGYPASVDNPAPTIRTKDGIALVQAQQANAQNQSIHQPAGTILTNDKHSIVEAVPFLMTTNYANTPQSINQPAPVITANRKHHYIINPAWGGNPGSIEEPCCVVVARQDKAPLYFVHVEQGPVKIAVYETDSNCMVRIKQFMAAYGLVDIKMRMLRVNELLRIQGFPDQYALAGNQADQKKFIGNSVVPHVVKAWCEAMAARIIENRQNKKVA